MRILKLTSERKRKSRSPSTYTFAFFKSYHPIKLNKQAYMIKIYYSLRFLVLLLFVSLGLAACKEDEPEPAPAPATVITNSVEVDGKAYKFVDGLVFDYGPFFLGSRYTHYNYDIAIVNAEIDLEDETYDYTKASAVLWIDLFSPGTTGFKTGTFQYIDKASMTESNTYTKYFFNFAFFGALQKDGYIYLEATGGTVKVSGTPHNYTLEYDLMLSNGKPLKGSYKSTFKYADYR